MWVRWNTTTERFEKSINDGASWTDLVIHNNLHSTGNQLTDIIKSDAGLDFIRVADPSTPLTVALVTEAGNVTAGPHRYVVSYITPLGETAAGATLSAVVTTDASHGKVDITLPISPDYRVTGRKLYRDNNDYGLFLVATINDNTTATYRDNKSNAELDTSKNAWYIANSTNKTVLVDGNRVFWTSDQATCLGLNTISSNILDSKARAQVFIGSRAGQNIAGTGVSGNVCVGHSCGAALRGANYNVTIGGYCAELLRDGSGNVIIGGQAGYGFYDEDGNTCIGFNTGMGNYTSNTAGSYNVYLGYYAGYHETGDFKLIIDTVQRASEAVQRTDAIIYGEISSNKYSQILTVNAKLSVAPLWNASGTTYTGLLVNATNTASAAGSLIADFQVGTVSKASISPTGALALASGMALSGGTVSDAGIVIPSAVPTTTTNALYNSSGTLYWNGSVLIPSGVVTTSGSYADPSWITTLSQLKVRTLAAGAPVTGTSTTAEQDLQSVTLPAGTLAADGDTIRITAHFKCAANTNNKRMRLFFGASAIADSGYTAWNNAPLLFIMHVTRTGATAQYSSGPIFWSVAVPVTYQSATASATLSNAITIKTTGGWSGNNAYATDITSMSLTVELLKP